LPKHNTVVYLLHNLHIGFLPTIVYGTFIFDNIGYSIFFFIYCLIYLLFIGDSFFYYFNCCPVFTKDCFFA